MQSSALKNNINVDIDQLLKSSRRKMLDMLAIDKRKIKESSFSSLITTESSESAKTNNSNDGNFNEENGMLQ